jgi:hypothetical protein
MHVPAPLALAMTLALALSAPSLRAQGSLSSMGFGYPVPSVSTRVAGSGGALADVDAVTPQNPSMLGGLQRIVLSVQAEPEYRTLQLGTVTERTTSQRIPLLAILLPAGKGVGFGLTAGSFLDRSYSTKTTGSALINGASVPTTDQLDFRGAVGMLRAGVGWQINRFLKIGAAGHLLTGENLVTRERRFADTLKFGGVLDSSRVTYFGRALSAGGEVRLFKGLAYTISYRSGFGMDTRVRDTVRTRASVPDQLAHSVRFDGIPGTVFAVGVEQVAWTRMRGLGSSDVRVRDAANWYVGGELSGPTMRGVPILFRGGYANRQLPFSPTAGQVTESRFAAGVGLPVARDAAMIDLSVQRASRVLGGGDARERSWLLGLGLQIRP